MNDLELLKWYEKFPIIKTEDIGSKIRCGFIPLRGEPYTELCKIDRDGWFKSKGDYYMVLVGQRPVYKENVPQKVETKIGDML
jgi:hypothetical protein